MDENRWQGGWAQGPAGPISARRHLQEMNQQSPSRTPTSRKAPLPEAGFYTPEQPQDRRQAVWYHSLAMQGSSAKPRAMRPPAMQGDRNWDAFVGEFAAMQQNGGPATQSSTAPSTAYTTATYSTGCYSNQSNNMQQQQQPHPANTYREQVYPPNTYREQVHPPNTYREQVHPPNTYREQVYPPNTNREQAHPTNTYREQAHSAGTYRNSPHSSKAPVTHFMMQYPNGAFPSPASQHSPLINMPGPGVQLPSPTVLPTPMEMNLSGMLRPDSPLLQAASPPRPRPEGREDLATLPHMEEFTTELAHTELDDTGTGHTSFTEHEDGESSEEAAPTQATAAPLPVRDVVVAPPSSAPPAATAALSPSARAAAAPAARAGRDSDMGSVVASYEGLDLSVALKEARAAQAAQLTEEQIRRLTEEGVEEMDLVDHDTLLRVFDVMQNDYKVNKIALERAQCEIQELNRQFQQEKRLLSRELMASKERELSSRHFEDAMSVKSRKDRPALREPAPVPCPTCVAMEKENLDEVQSTATFAPAERSDEVSWQEQCTTWRRKYQHAKEKHYMLQKRCEHLRTIDAAKQEEIIKLQEDSRALKAYKAELARTKEDSGKMQASTSTLQTDHTTLLAHYTELCEDHAQLSERLAATMAENRAHDAETAELKQQVKDLDALSKDSAGERNTEVERELLELRQKVQELEEQNAMLRQEDARRGGEHMEARAAASSSTLRADDLARKLTMMSAEREAAYQTVHFLEMERDSLQNRLMEIEEVQLRGKLDAQVASGTVEAARDAAQNKLRSYERQIAESNTRRSAAEERSAVHAGNFAALFEEVERFSSKVLGRDDNEELSVEKALSRMRTAASKMENELAYLQDKEAKLSSKLDDAMVELASTSETVTTTGSKSKHTDKKKKDKSKRKRRKAVGARSLAMAQPSADLPAPQKPVSLAHLLEPDNPTDLFKDLEECGTGSFGFIYKANDTRSNKQVAIKKTDPSNNGADVRLLQEEIFMLRTMQHENIVNLVGAFLHQRNLWLVMEYSPGGSLASRISKATKRGDLCLPEQEIRHISKEVLKALAFIHSLHRCHRDIKSDNILMGADNSVKLSDFGLMTQLTTELPTCAELVGTPYWMAPEIIMTQPYGTKADIYSFGALMMEMAELSPPYYAHEPMRALVLIANHGCPELKNPQQWSPEMLAVRKMAVDRTPDLRASAAELLRSSWFN